MKLFKVRIQYETVIRAETSALAEKDGEYIIRNEADDPADVVTAEEITSIEQLPSGWNGACRPWGSRDPRDRTIKQILTDKAS